MSSITVSDSERTDARISAETILRCGLPQHAEREFSVTFDYPPIPVDWSACDLNTYDGAPDSATRNQVGRGRTAEAALLDLLDILDDDAAGAA
ncbi:MAG: hypothetical protein HS128_23430 [Ideonella sp.]|nr:hypothetical protein [Ideonella sp.]